MYISTSKDRKRDSPITMENLIFLDGINGGFLGHVDSIQELSDILVLGAYTLIDESSRVGDELDVVSFDDDFVLLSRLFADDSILHLHDTDVSLAEVVADLHRLSTVDDVQIDWEMGVHRTHFVEETVLNTLNQILDV